MTYQSNSPRLQALIAGLAPPGKQAEVIAALKAGETPPPPKFPIGAPPEPTSPDAPFGVDASATAIAQFIVSANERRLKGCPPVAPSGNDESARTAKFITECNEHRLGRSR